MNEGTRTGLTKHHRLEAPKKPKRKTLFDISVSFGLGNSDIPGFPMLAAVAVLAEQKIKAECPDLEIPPDWLSKWSDTIWFDYHSTDEGTVETSMVVYREETDESYMKKCAKHEKKLRAYEEALKAYQDARVVEYAAEENQRQLKCNEAQRNSLRNRVRVLQAKIELLGEQRGETSDE